MGLCEARALLGSWVHCVHSVSDSLIVAVQRLSSGTHVPDDKMQATMFFEEAAFLTHNSLIKSFFADHLDGSVSFHSEMGGVWVWEGHVVLLESC